MAHVSSTMWRIKKQPSNTISCSDNALCLLVLVVGILYWGLQVTSSFSIWSCVLKGCYERIIFWRAKSWTLPVGCYGYLRTLLFLITIQAMPDRHQNCNFSRTIHYMQYNIHPSGYLSWKFHGYLTRIEILIPARWVPWYHYYSIMCPDTTHLQSVVRWTGRITR